MVGARRSTRERNSGWGISFISRTVSSLLWGSLCGFSRGHRRGGWRASGVSKGKEKLVGDNRHYPKYQRWWFCARCPTKRARFGTSRDFLPGYSGRKTWVVHPVHRRNDHRSRLDGQVTPGFLSARCGQICCGSHGVVTLN